jgi:ABC-2 type transport system ATP-binding protein
MNVEVISSEAPKVQIDHAPFAIVVRDLVKIFPGNKRALNGLTFNVESGNVFALLGPNGAGKSTAIKILTTLSRPDSGSALVAGADIVTRPSDVRRRIGCVAQTSGSDEDATGSENLMLQGRLCGMSGTDLTGRVDELLHRFDLQEARNLMVRTFSGGMRRKLDIAMGLIHRPSILFLDEPTTGLDPEARLALWGELMALKGSENVTVILTTHYVAIIDQGKIVAIGSPGKLKAELDGDSIELELSSPQSEITVLHALRGIFSPNEILIQAQTIHTRAKSGAVLGQTMLTALQESGIGVRSLQIKRPSLDDVYFQHTGRRYSSQKESS